MASKYWLLEVSDSELPLLQMKWLQLQNIPIGAGNPHCQPGSVASAPRSSAMSQGVIDPRNLQHPACHETTPLLLPEAGSCLAAGNEAS